MLPPPRRSGICVYNEKSDGTSCDDGVAWTKDDRCQRGICVGDEYAAPDPSRPPSTEVSMKFRFFSMNFPTEARRGLKQDVLHYIS